MTGERRFVDTGAWFAYANRAESRPPAAAVALDNHFTQEGFTVLPRPG